MERLRGRRIVLGVTGSIAAYKAPLILRELLRQGAEVRVVMSPSARQFVAEGAIAAFAPAVVDVFPTGFPGSWHVEWARWAEVMLIAPCSATTLSKLAIGLCDTAPTLVARSLPRTTPLVVAPAMDTELWEQPALQRAVAQLRAEGVWVLPPAYGELASGSVGVGRLPEVESILSTVEGALTTGVLSPWHRQFWSGRRVLVTAGPTREPIDAVRYLSNASSGHMGYALAEAFRDRGAEVALVTGPTALPEPPGVELHQVETAEQMYEAVRSRTAEADVIVATAAVADYTPAEPMVGKRKRAAEEWLLRLRPTPDILAHLAQQRHPGQILVGFALEVQEEWSAARQKLAAKGVDLLVLNSLRWGRSGFGREENTIALLFPDERIRMLPPRSKRVCAEWIVNAVEEVASAAHGPKG
ncbi:MAG: bifunctional phosphopantothenoylcysteine decarboxylase/phosphopantothenate--cysteine ligase CoaBC [Chlorobiota bacterium]